MRTIRDPRRPLSLGGSEGGHEALGVVNPEVDMNAFVVVKRRERRENVADRRGELWRFREIVDGEEELSTVAAVRVAEGVALAEEITQERKGALVAPAGLPRAERETALRAARKLYARQLIQISRTPLPLGEAGRMYLLRVAWRSPLGDAIVKQFGPELGTGRRIRWDARLAAAVGDARRGPVFLLGELASQLEATRTRRAELVRLVAPVATRTEIWKHVRGAEDARLLLDAVLAALKTILTPAELAEPND